MVDIFQTGVVVISVIAMLGIVLSQLLASEKELFTHLPIVPAPEGLSRDTVQGIRQYVATVELTR